MAARLFRWALRLYPRDHRALFAAEMSEVFDRARTDAWSRGPVAVLSFCIREGAGLLIAALRLRFGRTDAQPESWLWSLEAPALVVLLYLLGITASRDTGTFGFFFPVTYIVIALGVGALAWIAGRTCTILRSPRRYGRLTLAILVAAVIMPAGIHALEEVQIRQLLTQQRSVGYEIPGIAVMSGRAASHDSRIPGLTFTRVVTDTGGQALLLRLHRSHSAPPYLWIGGLLTGVLAFVSRRRALA